MQECETTYDVEPLQALKVLIIFLLTRVPYMQMTTRKFSLEKDCILQLKTNALVYNTDQEFLFILFF